MEQISAGIYDALAADARPPPWQRRRAARQPARSRAQGAASCRCSTSSPAPEKLKAGRRAYYPAPTTTRRAALLALAQDELAWVRACADLVPAPRRARPTTCARSSRRALDRLPTRWCARSPSPPCRSTPHAPERAAERLRRTTPIDAATGCVGRQSRSSRAGPLRDSALERRDQHPRADHHETRHAGQPPAACAERSPELKRLAPHHSDAPRSPPARAPLPRRHDPSRDCPKLANESVASWVLSPSSATKTASESGGDELPVHGCASTHTRRPTLHAGQRTALHAAPPQALDDLHGREGAVPQVDRPLLPDSRRGSDRRRPDLERGAPRFRATRSSPRVKSGDALYLVLDGKVRVHKVRTE
jgi:hypothetical protein